MAVTYRGHGALDAANNHGIARWRVADAAARAAIAATADELDRVAHQLDDDTFWVVLSASPTAWTQLGAAGGTGSGPDLSDATPSAVGTATAGVSGDASRADHAHGADPQTATNTSAIATNTSAIAANTSAIAAKAASATQVIAGAGLTGGGTLAADRTLNVVAGDASIVVSADSIAVGVLQSDAQHGNRDGGALHSAVVAGGNAGFMTGTDKSKLDGIAHGATAVTNGTSLTNDSAFGPLLPSALTAATVTDALNAAWALSPESVQPFHIRHNGVNTTPSMSGPIGVQNATGSVAIGSRASSYLQYRTRCVAATSAVAGNVAGAYYTQSGTTAGPFWMEIGLRMTYRIGYESLTAAMRSYAGITAALAPTNVDPAALTYCAGIGAPLGSGNLHVYNNNSSGAATDLDLGSSFPISLRASYEVTLVVPTPAAFTTTYAGIYYRVRRLDIKGAVAYGYLTTNIPDPIGQYCFAYWCSNNTDAAVCSLALMGVEGAVPY